MTIWFATGNPHKKRELAAILSDHSITTPGEAGITGFEPEETGATFLENALIKARALYRLVKAPVIADDSGLCVEALGGRPGIHSARYGTGSLTSTERNALLLRELGDQPQRGAYFVCAMAVLFNENRFCVVQETLEGEILGGEQGCGGFGYDPIFYIPDMRCTAAELSAEDKNRLSHRGKAGRMIQTILHTGGLETLLNHEPHQLHELLPPR